MKYLVGVDFGGSSSKATLLGEDGHVYATASREYPTYYPQNGWAEQDIDDSYDAMVANIRELLAVSGVRPEDMTEGGTIPVSVTNNENLGMNTLMHGYIAGIHGLNIVAKLRGWKDYRAGDGVNVSFARKHFFDPETTDAIRGEG